MMEPEIYYGRYYPVIAGYGSTYIVPCEAAECWEAVPAARLQPYVDELIDNPDKIVESQLGWLGRLQMPGYMDCTPWEVYETKLEALSTLVAASDDE